MLAHLAEQKKKLSFEDFTAFLADAIRAGKAQGGREELFWSAFEDQYCPPTAWRKEWEKGVVWPTSEAVAWLRGLPDPIKALARAFPPSCIVRGTVALRCPAPGQVAIVTSYIDPDARCPRGLISVRSHPEGLTGHRCKPEQLEVVGYYKGLIPEVLAKLLEEPI